MSLLCSTKQKGKEHNIVTRRKAKVDTLNNAITTEKKLINAVAKMRGLEKTAGLLRTWV